MVCIHLDAFHASNQHFSVIFLGFPRFWEPSQAELPNKLRRVSELARSEDLKDFNRIVLISGGFTRISEDLRGSRKLRRDPEPAGKPTACAF